MIQYVQQAIDLILGDMSLYAWYPALNDILIFIFSLVIIWCTFKLWKFILGGVFNLWQ